MVAGGWLGTLPPLARHSGESRNPAPCSCCFLKVQGFHSPCGRASHFLCLCKESNQRKHTPGGTPSGHPALQVREGAPGFVERTSVCAQRTGAHRARHPSGFSSAPSPRHRGPRLGGILPQKQQQPLALVALATGFWRSKRLYRRSAGMHGFVHEPAPFAAPSIAGDGGRSPQGRAHDARASAVSTGTCCQPTPPSPRSTGQSDSHDANRTAASGA